MSSKLLAKEQGACAFRSGRFLASLTFAALIALQASTVRASETAAPSLTVDGSRAPGTTLERSNVVFVPARGVFEKLGATVTTSASSVVAMKGGHEIARMRIGSRDAVVAGSARTLAAAPFVARGVAMLPLRVVGEAAGAEVVYASSPRSVRVTAERPAVVAQAAAPAATDAPASAATQDNGGIPWWVWLIVALLVLGIILWLLSRRKKEPVVSTTSRGRGDEPIIETRK